MKRFPDLPPVWLVVFLVLNWAIEKVVPGFPVGTFTTALSWSLIGLGLALIGWAAAWFWRRKTTIEPHHMPHKLIVEGPFRLSRNPIYLAMVIILIGAIFGRGQPISLFLLPIFVVVLKARFVLPEEDALAKTFGSDAEAYFKGTRRWL
ncbi:isoprenylcysteine carboxylmethyltransferase family protein [uncultured Litoreibacter sp.]|uniref:methyltransferase family protein n=1 Tax=uncultured Litoreibacter sp. TaxID=1392394 RepID=UPI00262D9ADE|nr:isoprenylcysteine carboxylmethyltransferase family protein [uncultured Litoreibacter sp.]